MDDLELLTTFRSDVAEPDAVRAARARRRLESEFGRAPRKRGRSRSRATLAALIAAPATGVAAGVLAIAGVFGGGGATIAAAAVIHRAHAALTPPPNMIFHTAVAGGGTEAESWQLTSPPYTVLDDKGPVSGPNPQESNNGSTDSWWDPATNTIHQQTATKGAAPTFADPLAQVRDALHAGNARLLGTATVDGAATYKIQFKNKGGFDSQSLVAYVDQRTYRPVLLADPQTGGGVVELRVTAFEYLPANATNMRLLSLTARHPGAKVVSGGTSPITSGAK